MLGIGVNVALRVEDLPPELRDRAGDAGPRPRRRRGRARARCSRALEAPWRSTPEALLTAWRARDALLGRPVGWAGGHGTGAGIDAAGRLLVDAPTGRASPSTPARSTSAARHRR